MCHACEHVVGGPSPSAYRGRSPDIVGIDFIDHVTRLKAQIIDRIVIWALWGLEWLVLAVFVLPLSDNEWFRRILVGFVVVVNPYTLNLVLVGVWGQNIGKMFVRIRVVNERGLPPGMWKAFVREFIGPLVGLLSLGVCYLWIIFDPEKRGWHDHLAGTWVVNDWGWKKQPFGWRVPLWIGRRFR